MVLRIAAILVFWFSNVTLGATVPQISVGQYYNNEQRWQAQEDQLNTPPAVSLDVTQTTTSSYVLHVNDGNDVASYALNISAQDKATLSGTSGTCELRLADNLDGTDTWVAEFDPTPCAWRFGSEQSSTKWIVGNRLFVSGDAHNTNLAEDYFGRSTGVALRQAFHYSGWFVTDPVQSIHATTTEEAQFVRGLELHTEGDRQELFRKDGTSTGIEVELAALTYQGTGAQILKLALYRVGESRAFTYIWSENGADRIGINLRWLQVGLTRKD
jgi:hypothetical protein